MAPKKLLLILAVFYTTVLTVFSLLKTSALPNIDLDNGDKYAHIIAYSILCLIWFLTLKAFKINKAILVAASIAIFYGIILEVLQGTLTEARTPDILDVLANCIGVAFVSVFLIIRNKTHVKKI